MAGLLHAIFESLLYLRGASRARQLTAQQQLGLDAFVRDIITFSGASSVWLAQKTCSMLRAITTPDAYLTPSGLPWTIFWMDLPQEGWRKTWTDKKRAADVNVSSLFHAVSFSFTLPCPSPPVPWYPAGRTNTKGGKGTLSIDIRDFDHSDNDESPPVLTI